MASGLRAPSGPGCEGTRNLGCFTASSSDLSLELYGSDSGEIMTREYAGTWRRAGQRSRYEAEGEELTAVVQALPGDQSQQGNRGSLLAEKLRHAAEFLIASPNQFIRRNGFHL
jgi:hypothetical protein